MNNEYKEYLIKIGLTCVGVSLLTLVSNEWHFLWFVTNCISLILLLFLSAITEKPFQLFEVLTILPILMFFTAMVFAFFNITDNYFALLFLKLTILTPIFITIGGFLQPKNLHG